ncbi:hypothetical protein [Methylotenera sp.]|uniref:hypothetical protein n=1 Tax=Methylotenera sp. TaxID=2051956 RepID=UPI002ED79717
MTEIQFDVIAALLPTRINKPKSKEAAKLVLVDGKRNIEACHITGLKPNAVGNAIKRYKNAHDLILTAYNDK